MAKEYSPATQRFRTAYFKKVPRVMRSAMRNEFCDFFKVSEATFHNKLSGSARTITTEEEAKWLEEANPTAIYRKRTQNVNG